MATYFYRDGKPHVTQFALPVNHRGEYDTPRGRVYTAQRLAELNDRAFSRANHKKECSMSQLAVEQQEREFQEFCTNYADLLEDLETYADQNDDLQLYQQAVAMGLPLSWNERTNAHVIIRRIKKGR